MERFFFHLRNDMFVDDEEGAVLEDVAAARSRAEAYALEMSAASILERNKLNLHHRIELADETGQIVLTVKFGDVLSVDV